MPKPPIPGPEIKRIIQLRKKGYSVPEISELSTHSKATVFKYCSGVIVKSPYLEILRKKQGGSRARMMTQWDNARSSAFRLLTHLTKKDKLLLLLALYWGEGNKRELNLINSDPSLIKAYVHCLKEFGVPERRFKFTLRIYQDINPKKAIAFWANILDILPSTISNVNVLYGKKVGKLQYGMCRVRVEKGAPYFKLLMSLIEKVRIEIDAAVVQRIERGTPKP